MKMAAVDAIDAKAQKANNAHLGITKKEDSFRLLGSSDGVLDRLDGNKMTSCAYFCNAPSRMGPERRRLRPSGTSESNQRNRSTHRSVRRRRTSSSETFVLLSIPRILLATTLFVYANNNVNWEIMAQEQRQNRELGGMNENLLPSEYPDGWETFSMAQIYYHFECHVRDHDTSKSNPMMSLQDWQYLRDKFTEHVGASTAFDDPVPPTQGYTLNDQGPPPYYAKHSEGKGRGLFASRDIRKGEVVHDGTGSDVMFPDSMAYRRFVFSLPKELACDMSHWTWTQKDESGKFRHYLAPNISSFMNAEKSPNTLPESEVSFQMKATRDIAKDEEILTDYDAYETNWAAVGL